MVKAREGSPERPGRKRYHWDISSVDPVPDSDLFYLTQKVTGSWVMDPDNPEWSVVYVPRDPELPPIFRVRLSSLDDHGAIKNELEDPARTEGR